MTAPAASPKKLSSGVQELVDRLREQGVEEGREKAAALVREAEARAAVVVSKARDEAERLVREARDEAARLRSSGEEALRLAARDAVLALKAEMAARFSDQVRRMVGSKLRDEEFLQRLIVEIAGRAVEDARSKPMEVLLPRDVVGLDDLRRNPESAREGTLSHFVMATAGDVIREGVVLLEGPDDAPGLRVRLKDDGVEIDLTDRAVSDLLLAHLLPRFRAVVEGIVQ